MHKQACSNCSNETTERNNCSADVLLESRESVSQAHLRLSTTVSTCPLEYQHIRSQVAKTRHSNSSFSPLATLTSSHLFSITFSVYMRKKHILTETSPPSQTPASTKQHTPGPPDTHSTTSVGRLGHHQLGAKHSTEKCIVQVGDRHNYVAW